MIHIFWDVKEKPKIKHKITAKLQEAYTVLENFSQSTAKVIFTDSKKIKQLNRTYRKIDKETDVLSFAELDLENVGTEHALFLREEKNLGEIYINYDWVKKEKDPSKYASTMLIHGYLHLLGYDHEKDKGEMNKLEGELIKTIEV